MGRRFSMYLSTLTATIGILLLLIENMWAMLLGKLFLGISMGLIFTMHGRVLEEFSPPHLYDTFLTTFILLATLVDSICVATASAWLPQTKEELLTS